MKLKKGLTAVAASALVMTTAATTAFAQTTNDAVMPSPTTSNAAINLRGGLDSLLGEHAFLAILAMEKGYSGAPDFNAVAAELNDNTTKLSQAIASVYGQAAGTAFQQMWSAHIQDFVDYVTATAKNDPAGQKAALDKLNTYKDQFAKFLASANPNYDATTLESGLQTHINELVTAFTDYVNKDYTGAANEMVTAYEHMYMTGDLLAAGIVKQFPDKFGHVSTDTAAANLRVTLDEYLGLHAALAVTAMAKGYAGDPDFSAVAAALGQDTTDLTNAITSVYGADAGMQFNKIWSAHIGNFVDYVNATAKDDKAGQQAALTALAGYKTNFSQFLATADPKLDASALADGLQTHINQLIGAFTAYTNKDYTTAETDFDDAYNHMVMTGDTLSAAIAAQFPSKFESAGDTWTWTDVHLTAGGKNVVNPLGVWGVNPATNMSDVYVPIWYVMYALKQEGIQSTWNGSSWNIMTSHAAMSTGALNDGSHAVMVNGQSVGSVNTAIVVDPWSQMPTQYMAASDVKTILADAGLSASWDGMNNLSF